MLTNDGTVISYLKTIKGGYLANKLFKIERNCVELAIATKASFTNLREYDTTLKVALIEFPEGQKFKINGKITEYKYQVLAGHEAVTNDQWVNYGMLRTNDFNEANQFFLDIVKSNSLQGHFYSLNRYKNQNKDFNYLKLLKEESKLL